MEASFSSWDRQPELNEVVVDVDPEDTQPMSRPTTLEVRVLSPGHSNLSLRVNKESTCADLELMVHLLHCSLTQVLDLAFLPLLYSTF